MEAKTLGGLVLAALLGGAVGGLVGGGLGPAPSASRDRGEAVLAPAEAAEKVVALETRVLALERRRPRARAAANDEEGEPDTLPDHGRGTTPRDAAAGLDAPSEAGEPRALDRQFVDDVEAALRLITERRKAREAEAKREQQREKYLQDLDRRLADYQERLGLTDGQIADVSRLAHDGVARYMEAQAGGATPEKLGEIGRSLSRSVRDLIGPDTYRGLRLLDLDRAARPRIVDIANRAGVDASQRQRIEGLLADHLEGIVDREVRLRTEEMPADDRTRLRETLNDANRNAWDRIRGDILTEEQRSRVPIRLR
jgi:hypothetical protein